MILLGFRLWMDERLAWSRSRPNLTHPSRPARIDDLSLIHYREEVRSWSVEFVIRTTSSSSAKIEDVRLDVQPDPDTTLTRKIVRPELVDNAHSDEARVKITIVHQKRHKKSEEWQDTPNFNAATLKAGQEIKLYLDAGENASTLPNT